MSEAKRLVDETDDLIGRLNSALATNNRAGFFPICARSKRGRLIESW
ncbi:MAG: hypothetical protein R3A47_10730 [Polyangiales bacterium]